VGGPESLNRPGQREAELPWLRGACPGVALPPMASGSRTVLLAALAANLLIALTKFGAAAFTHSSAMLSEAVHSLVDTSNEVLLMYGARQAARPPDDAHPLGVISMRIVHPD